MKVRLLFLLAILSLVACSNNASTNLESSSSSSDSHFIQQGIGLYSADANLLCSGVKDFNIFRSSSHIFEEEKRSSQYIYLESYQDVITYKNHLKEFKDSYYDISVYNQTISFLDSLQEENFLTHALIMSKEMELGSGSYSDRLIDINIQEEIVNIHLGRYVPRNHGYSHDTMIVFESLTFFINKNVQVNNVKIKVTEE